MDDLPPNPEIPPRVADAFVQSVADYGYKLNYTLQSLTDEVDRIFEDPRFIEIKVVIQADGSSQKHCFQNCLAAYMGEVFVRQYHGQWIGNFTQHRGANFYTSSIRFGEYVFWPFAYVGYRLSNGVTDTGDLAHLISRTRRSMQKGINYKREEIRKITRQGKIAIDNEPWD